jgi:hypothetical protein
MKVIMRTVTTLRPSMVVPMKMILRYDGARKRRGGLLWSRTVWSKHLEDKFGIGKQLTKSSNYNFGRA